MNNVTLRMLWASSCYTSFAFHPRTSSIFIPFFSNETNFHVQSVLKNIIPWGSIARHCPGKDTYRKIHPKGLCNIDSVKFNTSLSKNGMTNTKMINMKETLRENSIGYRPPPQRKFVNKFWTVPLIVWQKILLICSNILPPIFHTTNFCCEILFWIIMFSYSKVWQEKSNFLHCDSNPDSDSSIH